MTQRKTGPFRPIPLLNVEIDLDGLRHQVGRLAWRDRVAYFEYDQAFLSSGLDLSPFRLKLGPGLMEGPPRPFDGLHGLFNDSLPDGWGRLLMDRKLHRIGLHPGQLTPLDRLAWVGTHGMGALIYRPEHPPLADGGNGLIDLDKLSGEARKVLNDSPRAVLDELLAVGGSPHGARPKALVGLANDHSRLIHGVDEMPDGFDPWMVKFRAAADPIDIGAIENAYAGMAGAAGVDMPPTKLFPARKGPGFFGIKRFDRVHNRRVHMHTVSGLLNASHEHPSIGYGHLLRVAWTLVRRQSAVEQMFTRMAFNVFAFDRDDHTKNHSFMMAPDGAWLPAPAYDVTFSMGHGGEHALDVAGSGNPGIEHVLKLADEVGIGRGKSQEIIDRVRSVASRWPEFADAGGVSKKSLAVIDLHLNGPRKPARRPRPAGGAAVETGDRP